MESEGGFLRESAVNHIQLPAVDCTSDQPWIGRQERVGFTFLQSSGKAEALVEGQFRDGVPE